MATKQETFDAVVAHARQQGCKAMLGDEDTCAYRGEGGTKCFVGALIPDNKYSPNMESKTLDDRRIARLMKGLGHDVPLLRRLQIVHDTEAEVELPQFFAG